MIKVTDEEFYFDGRPNFQNPFGMLWSLYVRFALPVCGKVEPLGLVKRETKKGPLVFVVGNRPVRPLGTEPQWAQPDRYG